MIPNGTILIAAITICLVLGFLVEGKQNGAKATAWAAVGMLIVLLTYRSLGYTLREPQIPFPSCTTPNLLGYVAQEELKRDLDNVDAKTRAELWKDVQLGELIYRAESPKYVTSIPGQVFCSAKLVATDAATGTTERTDVSFNIHEVRDSEGLVYVDVLRDKPFRAGTIEESVTAADATTTNNTILAILGDMRRIESSEQLGDITYAAKWRDQLASHLDPSAGDYSSLLDSQQFRLVALGSSMSRDVFERLPITDQKAILSSTIGDLRTQLPTFAELFDDFYNSLRQDCLENPERASYQLNQMKMTNRISSLPLPYAFRPMLYGAPNAVSPHPPPDQFDRDSSSTVRSSGRR